MLLYFPARWSWI